MMLRTKAATEMTQMNPGGINLPDFDQRMPIIPANSNDAPKWIDSVNLRRIDRSMNLEWELVYLRRLAVLVDYESSDMRHSLSIINHIQIRYLCKYRLYAFNSPKMPPNAKPAHNDGIDAAVRWTR